MENIDILSQILSIFKNALDLGDRDKIEESAKKFFNEWYKNEFLNTYYRKSDFLKTIKTLTEYYTQNKIPINDENKSVIMNLPVANLKQITIQNQDFISPHIILELQDKILEDGDLSDIMDIADVKGVDFIKIQEKVLQSADTVALKDFFLSHQDKANIELIYNRVYEINKYGGTKEIREKRNQMLKILQPYAIEYRRKKREESEKQLELELFKKGRQY